MKDHISISPIPVPPSEVCVEASVIPNFINVSISKGTPLSDIEIAGVPFSSRNDNSMHFSSAFLVAMMAFSIKSERRWTRSNSEISVSLTVKNQHRNEILKQYRSYELPLS